MLGQFSAFNFKLETALSDVSIFQIVQLFYITNCAISINLLT